MSDPVAVGAGLTSMNRTREQWEAVNPGAFLTGSIVQARNVIEMARADILRLYAALQAAEERGAERMRERERDEAEAVALVDMAIDIAKARVILKATAQRAQSSHGSEDDLSAIYRDINVAVRLITPPIFREPALPTDKET